MKKYLTECINGLEKDALFLEKCPKDLSAYEISIKRKKEIYEEVLLVWNFKIKDLEEYIKNNIAKNNGIWSLAIQDLYSNLFLQGFNVEHLEENLQNFDIEIISQFIIIFKNKKEGIQ